MEESTFVLAICAIRMVGGRLDMVRYLSGFANHFDLKIRYGTRVLRVHKNKDGTFRVRDAQGNIYSSRHLIVASGVSESYTPDIEGIELAESYAEVSIHPEDFAGQSVLIVGKGNSAFETAENLIGATSLMHLVSPTPLKLAWKSHYVGHVRAVNLTLADTYLLKSQNVFLDATVRKIEKRADGELVAHICYSHAQNEEEELIYDRIILCTGFRFDTSIFDGSCMPKLAINDRFPMQTSAWE
ncbi:MAG: NAD(P)-binding domain-containing protein, partial [Planctomycetes bacterium]|nr:NAD(P)-binding domain-containing protein [Planctomycetota bacterium]